MNDLLLFLKFLIRKRVLIVVNSVIATIIALVVVLFFTPIQYASSITFFPPYEEKGLMSFIPGMSGVGITTSSDIMPQQINTIYSSRVLRLKFIDELNLISKYELDDIINKNALAMKLLNDDLYLDVEELGSLGMSSPIGYTMTFFHTNPDSAYHGVTYLYHLLDSTIRNISMTNGREKREFVEQNLRLAESKYDSLKIAFNSFKVDNKAYDMSTQVDLTIRSYAQLSSQMTTLELNRSRMLSEYSSNHPAITQVNREISLIRSKLRNIEESTDPQVIGGLEKSVDLLPKYLEYTRDIEFQSKMILLLYQQYEEALLKETNDLSSLKNIDPATVPVYKARPKRAVLLIVTFAKYMVVVFIVLIISFFVKYKLPEIKWLSELKNEFQKK